MVDLHELAEEVRVHGLARVFAARGRELVASPDARRLITGENLDFLIRADPDLRPFAEGPPSHGPSRFTLTRFTLTRRALVALAAAGWLETNVAVSRAASIPDIVRARRRERPHLREAGRPAVHHVDRAEFRNWGGRCATRRR